MPDYDPDYEEEPEIGHGSLEITELYDQETLLNMLGSLMHHLTQSPEPKPRMIGFHHPPPLKAAHKAKPAKKRPPTEAPKRPKRR